MSHGEVEFEILQIDTFELIFPSAESWDYSGMSLCPGWLTPLSKGKKDGPDIQADNRTNSVTGHEDVNHLRHEGSWRMKDVDPV